MQDATCYCGNLDEQVNEELLWELMIQVWECYIVLTDERSYLLTADFI